MESWYLIQTKPRQEYLARENLERQGYRTYLPIAPVRRRKGGRTFSSPGPMFPRYLFIHLNEGIDDWGPIRSTLGVAKLVKFGMVPARIPDGLINTLMTREDAQGVQVLPSRVFKAGDRVRVTEGLFEGYEAVVQAKTARERILVLMNIIESHLKVELPGSTLEIITS